jgi:hypothetical protein
LYRCYLTIFPGFGVDRPPIQRSLPAHIHQVGAGSSLTERRLGFFLTPSRGDRSSCCACRGADLQASVRLRVLTVAGQRNPQNTIFHREDQHGLVHPTPHRDQNLPRRLRTFTYGENVNAPRIVHRPLRMPHILGCSVVQFWHGDCARCSTAQSHFLRTASSPSRYTVIRQQVCWGLAGNLLGVHRSPCA